MEELKSTEVLDRELLEDARKKAYKILKTAEETLVAQTQDWERRTQDAVNSIRKVYEGQTKKASDEILARFPLDKRRLRSETAERLLKKAMDDFLRSLSREKLVSILERELAERLKVSCDEGEGGTILYSGMSPSEADALLKKLPGAWKLKEDPFVHEFPSVVINTKSIRITASVDAAADALLKDKRAELAAALLGEGVLND